MTAAPRPLPIGGSLAVEFLSALLQGDVEAVAGLLQTRPGLSSCLLVDPSGDAGADIERPGSSIGGGSALQSAVGYGQWNAARRLVERGARCEIWHAAGLGLVPLVVEALNTRPAPSVDDLGGSLVNASDQGQMAAAKLLLAHGSDVNWATPWSGETPLDRATAQGHTELAVWLTEHGAR